MALTSGFEPDDEDLRAVDRNGTGFFGGVTPGSKVLWASLDGFEMRGLRLNVVGARQHLVQVTAEDFRLSISGQPERSMELPRERVRLHLRVLRPWPESRLFIDGELAVAEEHTPIDTREVEPGLYAASLKACDGAVPCIGPQLPGCDRTQVVDDAKTVICLRTRRDDTLPLDVVVVPGPHDLRIERADGKVVSGRVTLSSPDEWFRVDFSTGKIEQGWLPLEEERAAPATDVGF